MQFLGQARLLSMMEIPTPDAVEPNSPKTLRIGYVAELRPPTADLAVFSVQLRSSCGKGRWHMRCSPRKAFKKTKLCGGGGDEAGANPTNR